MAGVILKDSEIEKLVSGKDSLHRDVYNTLLSMLLNKQLVPGQIINRREIAKDLNVSVAPVLEALVLLEQDGFVQTLPRKGTLVSPATVTEIFGRLVVREALEIEAASFYCGKKIRDNYQELIEYAKQMDKARVNSIEHAKMEIIIHSSLVNLAGVPSLFKVFTKNIRLGIFFRLNSIEEGNLITTHQSHESFVASLCCDDKHEAEEIVRKHVRSGKTWALYQM